MTSSHASTRDLKSALQRQAQRAGERAPSVRGADWRMATVTAVGDVTIISQSGNGNWIALGPLATT